MKNYIASDFFMVRTPLLPTEDYVDMDNLTSMNEYKKLWEGFKTPWFKEALSVASGDLFEAMNRINQSEGSKSFGQVLSSLLKYYIRATTRPTPFGLFSGISIGKFGNKTDITLASRTKHQKRARIDMEWAYKVIHMIEGDLEIRNSLRVRFNDFTYLNGDRLEKPSQTFLQDGDSGLQNTTTSIRYTMPVKILQEYAKDFQSILDLVHRLSQENPSTSRQKIECIISQLLENEYLISELRPPLINTDILNYLIDTLERMQNTSKSLYYVTKLKEIREAIEIYNATPIGDGLIAYQNIICLMSSLCKCKSYLQVDTKLQTLSNYLDQNLKSDLEEFVSAMVRLTPEDDISDEMLNYKKLFVEKYGYNVEVPVLELLDTDKGLGAPMNYSANVVRRPSYHYSQSPKIVRLNAMLERKIMLALRQNQNTVEITEKDIDYVASDRTHFGGLQPVDAPQSFELYLLAHPGEKSKNDYYFTIAPAICSRGVGHSFGRFIDILSKKEQKMIEETIHSQQEFLDDYVIAEIAELPVRGRTSNVTINNSFYNYQIALTTNHCEDKKIISIQDLYIGLDRENQQFYIHSKKLNKKVLVVMTSMLNPTYGSTVLKFLREISSARHIDVTNGISKLIMNKFDYSPRITYKKVIIKPETWLISEDILGLHDMNQESFLQKFQEYKIQWGIPRYVFMTEYDNRLLLDLENPQHLNELYNGVKHKHSKVVLIETTCSLKDYAAIDENGNHYVTEVVIPFILDPSVKGTNSEKREKSFFLQNDNINQNCMNISREQVAIFPGQHNWLFFKLYGCSKRQDELISLIYPELEKYVEQGQIQQYFFIRYSDPEYHMRIRVKAKENRLSSCFLRMNKYFEQLCLNGVINKVVIDTYYRELERYGGELLIEDAEQYFFRESRLIMSIISQKRYGLLDMDIEYIAISFVASILSAFGLTLQQQEEFLDTIVNLKLFRKEFQKDRKILMDIIDNGESLEYICSNTRDPKMHDTIVQTIESINQYAQHVLELNRLGLITNSVENILSSIMHMFCNRMVGDNHREQKVYTLTRHAIHALLERKKHLKHNIDI